MTDLDVEAMLEAPYKIEKNFNSETKESEAKENGVLEDHSENKEENEDIKNKSEDENDNEREEKDERDGRNGRDDRDDRDGRDEREKRHHSRSHRSRHSSRSSHRHSHHSHRHRSRRRSRSNDRHKSSSRSRSYRSERRSRSISRRRSRSRSRSRTRTRSRSRSPRNISEDRNEKPEMSEADRDRRTVFVMQLSAKLRTSELRDFFSSVGKVSDVKIIADRNSRRSKGVGYVEFEDEASVEKALTLSNKTLLGIPIIVQKTESEKNRSEVPNNPNTSSININRTKINSYNTKDQNDSYTSYKRLYVGSINFMITEDDLRILFKNFGELDFVKLHINPETGRSCGYAFIQYKRPEDARKALDIMNGKEIAGRVIKVGLVSDKAVNSTDLNLDDSDTVGFSMNSYERANLMQKLSRNGEMQVPTVTQPYMKVQNPTITTNVLLTNMFNPEEETEPGWENEIEEEVGGECSKFGKILNIVVANNTKGNVYIKYADITSAQQAVAGLNGRYFAGKQISASFIIDAVFPQKNY